MEGDSSQEMPDLSLEELMNILQNMKGLDDSERQELIKNLGAYGAPKDYEGLFKDSNPGMPVPLPEPWFTHQTMVLAAMLGLVAVIFVFFGYKLIRSIKDKEKKKEEKKKQKQSKKKK